MSCRLCYVEAGMLLPIFSNTGVDSMGMANSIHKFLGIEVHSDEDSNKICPCCWANIKNFQNFYNMIAEKQSYNNTVVFVVDVEHDNVFNDEDLSCEEEETVDGFTENSNNTMLNQSDEDEHVMEDEPESVEENLPVPGSRFKWNPATHLELIKEYRKRPELWNVQNKDYHNENVKNGSVQDIADILGCSTHDVTQKIVLFRAHYFSEYAKMKNKKYKSKWALFKSLKFLKSQADDFKDVYGLNDRKHNNDTDDNQQNTHDWSEEEIFHLIDECKKWPVLWKKKHPEFHSRFFKYEGLNEVSKATGLSGNIVWEKFSNLRAFFYREVRTMAKKPAYQTNWKYFKRLLYLRKNLTESEQQVITRWIKHYIENQATANRGFTWTKGSITQLISLYESHPEIWNKQCTEYNDNKLKVNNLRKIAEDIGCTPTEAHRKFSILRTYFKRELTKAKERIYDDGSRYVSNWRYLNDLMFLKEYLT